MANLDAVEKAKKYATDKYLSQRDALRRLADVELSQTRERLGRAGMSFSSSMDREVGENRAALIRTLVRTRVDALIDGFELNGVPIVEPLEHFIIAEAENVNSVAMEQAVSVANSLGTPRMGTLAINIIRAVEVPVKAIHCQIEERRARPRVAPHPAPVMNVYHLTGDNSRVNVSSTDDSTNVVVSNSKEIFEMIRDAVNSGTPQDEQSAILRRLDALEKAQHTPSYAERYKDFIAAAANHMTLIAPFIPALTELIDRFPK